MLRPTPTGANGHVNIKSTRSPAGAILTRIHTQMDKKSELLPLFIDIDEAAELLRIGSSVYKLINEEKLKATKFGRRTVLRYRDVVAFADEAAA